MPNYKDIIETSHQSIQTLNHHVQGLEELKNKINQLIDKNEALDKKNKGMLDEFNLQFTKVITFSKDYTENLGQATRDYIDGTNDLLAVEIKALNAAIVEIQSIDLEGEFAFTQNKFIQIATKTIDEQIEKIDAPIGVLNKEIQRFETEITNFDTKFEKLQAKFLEDSKKTISSELQKIDTPISVLNKEIKRFEIEIQRLESIDLENHFAKHQKTLSEVFSALSSVNLTLTKISQNFSLQADQVTSLVRIVQQSQNDLTRSLDSQHKIINELKQAVEESEATVLSEIQNTRSKIFQQNLALEKSININRYIFIGGVVLVLIFLIIIFLK
jgi:chromosome segregation ATPase